LLLVLTAIKTGCRELEGGSMLGCGMKQCARNLFIVVALSGKLMSKRILVKDVMTKRGDVVSVKEHDHIDDLFEHYKTHHYHSFPVLKDGDELKGVVDEDVVLIRLLYDYLPPRDFSLMIGRAEIKNIERYISGDIGKLCSHPITISPQARIEEAVAIMIRNNVDRMMVTEAGRLVGVISKRDIIRKLIKLAK